MNQYYFKFQYNILKKPQKPQQISKGDYRQLKARIHITQLYGGGGGVVDIKLILVYYFIRLQKT